MPVAVQLPCLEVVQAVLPAKDGDLPQGVGGISRRVASTSIFLSRIVPSFLEMRHNYSNLWRYPFFHFLVNIVEL